MGDENVELERNEIHYSFIDQSLLDNIESCANHSTKSLNALAGHLHSQLQSLSSLSVQYMKLHKMSIENVSEEIASCVVSIQILISKCQQLNIELKKAETLHKDIKEARRFLDVLENHINKIIKPRPH